MLKSQKTKKMKYQKPWFLTNKKAMGTEMLIKILILIVLFAIIAFSVGYLLKKFGVA